MTRNAPIAGVLCAIMATQCHAEPVRPVPDARCAMLAAMLTKATRIPLTRSVGAVDTAHTNEPAGTACLLTGKTAGLNDTFFDGVTALKAAFAGWREDPDFAADGGASTVVGYMREDQHVIVHLSTDPPPNACLRVAVGYCEVQRRRWIWSLNATAYRT